VGLRVREIKAGVERDAKKKGRNVENMKDKQEDKEKRKQKELTERNEGKR
jgi:hypothetical protein